MQWRPEVVRDVGDEIGLELLKGQTLLLRPATLGDVAWDADHAGDLSVRVAQRRTRRLEDYAGHFRYPTEGFAGQGALDAGKQRLAIMEHLKDRAPNGRVGILLDRLQPFALQKRENTLAIQGKEHDRHVRHNGSQALFALQECCLRLPACYEERIPDLFLLVEDHGTRPSEKTRGQFAKQHC